MLVTAYGCSGVVKWFINHSIDSKSFDLSSLRRAKEFSNSFASANQMGALVSIPPLESLFYVLRGQSQLAISIDGRWERGSLMWLL